MAAFIVDDIGSIKETLQGVLDGIVSRLGVVGTVEQQSAAFAGERIWNPRLAVGDAPDLDALAGVPFCVLAGLNDPAVDVGLGLLLSLTQGVVAGRETYVQFGDVDFEAEVGQLI